MLGQKFVKFFCWLKKIFWNYLTFSTTLKIWKDMICLQFTLLWHICWIANECPRMSIMLHLWNRKSVILNFHIGFTKTLNIGTFLLSYTNVSVNISCNNYAIWIRLKRPLENAPETFITKMLLKIFSTNYRYLLLRRHSPNRSSGC